MKKLAEHRSCPDCPRCRMPAVLWVKAQMLRRWDAERKAQAPLDVMEPLQIAAGLPPRPCCSSGLFPSLLQVLFTSI